MTYEQNLQNELVRLQNNVAITDGDRSEIFRMRQYKDLRVQCTLLARVASPNLGLQERFLELEQHCISMVAEIQEMLEVEGGQ